MAGETVIIQSHRNSGLPAWIDVCLGSVRAWASDSGFRYAFFGDEMMDRVPLDWREKTAAHPQIAADIGRLYLLRDTLEQGAARAVWLDADVFVFAPQRMRIATESSFAFGREVWIEAEGSRAILCSTSTSTQRNRFYRNSRKLEVRHKCPLR